MSTERWTALALVVLVGGSIAGACGGSSGGGTGGAGGGDDACGDLEGVDCFCPLSGELSGPECVDGQIVCADCPEGTGTPCPGGGASCGAGQFCLSFDSEPGSQECTVSPSCWSPACACLEQEFTGCICTETDGAVDVVCP